VLLTVALLRTARRDARIRGPAELLAAILVAQGVVGYVQYFTGVPAALVLIHVAGATAMWWAATNVALSVNTTSTLVRSDDGARSFAGSR